TPCRAGRSGPCAGTWWPGHEDGNPGALCDRLRRSCEVDGLGGLSDIARSVASRSADGHLVALVLTVDDPEVAVLVDGGDVPGVQEAVGVDGRLRGLGIRLDRSDAVRRTYRPLAARLAELDDETRSS